MFLMNNIEVSVDLIVMEVGDCKLSLAVFVDHVRNPAL